jgi:excisionase family DNA binding protein
MAQRRLVEVRFFTIKEIAEQFGVNERTVRRWIASGDLVAIKLNGTVRVSEDDYRTFLALHRTG